MDKTIYGLRFERGSIGPKEHSFVVTFLVHGINVSTILNYAMGKYFNVNTPLYLGLIFAILIFTIGYLVYFKSRRANKVIGYDVTNAKAAFFVILSLAYVVVSVYLMFEVDNYLRDRLAK